MLDAIRALQRDRRAWVVLGALLLLPGVSIGIGFAALGAAKGFALGLFGASVLLEVPTRGERDRTRSPTRTVVAAPPAQRPALLLAGGEVAAVVVLAVLGVGFATELIRGLLWGAAIAGITDLGRTLAALYLAANDGAPLYSRAFRWANTARDLGPKRTWHLFAAFARDRTHADEFKRWAAGNGAAFVAVRYEDHPEWPDSRTLIWDGEQVWIGNEAVIVPLDALTRE